MNDRAPSKVDLHSGSGRRSGHLRGRRAGWILAHRPFVALVVVALSFLCLVQNGRAAPQDPDEFLRGNRSYAAGQFADAAKLYEDAVHHGDYRANLFYNLANTYYRLGQRGRAILNYRRALILEPGHAEAAANLAFVRGPRALQSGGRAPGVLGPLWAVLAGVEVNTYCRWAAASGWLAVLGLGLAIFRRQARVLGLALAVCGTLGTLLFAAVIFEVGSGLQSPDVAIVLTDDTPARYAPADNARSIVRVPAGGEVHVLSGQGAWAYVRLADGTRGWMATTELGRIDPAAGS